MSATALINSSRFMQQSSQNFMLQGFQPKPADLTTKPSVEQRVDAAAGFVKFDDTSDYEKFIDDGSSLVAPVEPTKSLFQRMTQPKVLIGVGIALTTIAAIGAAYAFPVATAAHAMTIGHAARSTLIHTHAFLQPGLAANALLLDIALKTTGVAASIAMPVISPALSIAVVGALGGIAVIYLANKVWAASKVVICSSASFALNKLDEKLCQSGPGLMIKNCVILPVYSAVDSVFGLSALAPVTQPTEQSEKPQIVANPEKVEEKSQGISKPVAAATIVTVGLVAGLLYNSGMNLSDFWPAETV